MRALLVRGPGRYAVEDVPEPAPGPGQVLVEVVATGICGSDLELVDGRRPAAYVRYPVVPGHEWSGTIVQVGESAAALGWRVGERVAGGLDRRRLRLPCRRFGLGWLRFGLRCRGVRLGSLRPRRLARVCALVRAS